MDPEVTPQAASPVVPLAYAIYKFRVAIGVVAGKYPATDQSIATFGLNVVDARATLISVCEALYPGTYRVLDGGVEQMRAYIPPGDFSLSIAPPASPLTLSTLANLAIGIGARYGYAEDTQIDLTSPTIPSTVTVKFNKVPAGGFPATTVVSGGVGALSVVFGLSAAATAGAYPVTVTATGKTSGVQHTAAYQLTIS